MGEGNTPLVVDFLVTGIKQFLPAGPVAASDPPSRDAIRERHLIQLYTDRGMRTVAVADLRNKAPRKRTQE